MLEEVWVRRPSPGPGTAKTTQDEKPAPGKKSRHLEADIATKLVAGEGWRTVEDASGRGGTRQRHNDCTPNSPDIQRSDFFDASTPKGLDNFPGTVFSP